MRDRSLYGRTAIVGVGESDFQKLYRDPDPERTLEELAVEAVARALDDAGLAKDDIDGLITGGVPRYEPIMFRAGLQDVRFLVPYPQSGRMCSVALAHAAMAVNHGLANYVVLFHTLNFRSQGLSFGGERSV